MNPVTTKATSSASRPTATRATRGGLRTALSQSGVLLLLPLMMIMLSAISCSPASPPREVTRSAEASAEATAATTATERYMITPIELRGEKRPRRAASLQGGHLILPQGDVTAAAGCMVGGPLAVPLGDLEALIDQLESTPMNRGRAVLNAETDAKLYLDIDTGGGERSVLSVRFGSGDAVQLENYGYGSEYTAATQYETRDSGVAKTLRDAVGYEQVARTVLDEAGSAVLLPSGLGGRHALKPAEVALIKRAVVRAEPKSGPGILVSRVEYDCTFDFALPGGERQVVTYDSGRGTVGLGTSTFAIMDHADRLALRSLLSTYVDVSENSLRSGHPFWR